MSGRHVGFGDGVYKSLNGGKTWTNMGLKKSEHISKILVDPRDSNVAYVAAEGPLWSCQVIDVDMKQLQEAMEAAGAPWTPGRGVPRWKKK